MVTDLQLSSILQMQICFLMVSCKHSGFARKLGDPVVQLGHVGLDLLVRTMPASRRHLGSEQA
jgi:hypothetical protein